MKKYKVVTANIKALGKHVIQHVSFFPNHYSFKQQSNSFNRIPFENGKELAEKYEVLDKMMPLLTFDPASISGKEKIPTKEQVQQEAKLQLDTLASHSPPHSPKDTVECRRQSLLSSQKKTQPSRKKIKLVANSPQSSNSQEESFDEHHRNLLMNIFLSDNPDDTPTALASTLLTNDINIDLVIDEQGHTALHWAAALGRTKIVDLLISNGANVCSINLEGETPLMRAAMITCCYENKCFSHMVEMMSDAITVFDRKGRTILHHIALTADVDGYAEAAVYYMKRLFKTAPKKIVLKNMLNIQDRFYGETALAIALRAGCPEISDYLTKQGASDPLLSNLEPDRNVEFIPIDYKQNSKGPDIIACKYKWDRVRIHVILKRFSLAFHNQIGEMEEHYLEQLRQRDIESFQTKKEMNMLRYQLNEAQRRLELPVSMQLAEAQKRIHELEHQKVICDDLLIGNESKQEQEPNLDAEEKSTKERKLEKRIKMLQNQVESSAKTIEKLKAESEVSQVKSKQKEMEYRRLIAASCNLPIEKVDGLIGPLTLAIESDPPDLDMARVIGFMERLRKPNTPHDTTTPV